MSEVSGRCLTVVSVAFPLAPISRDSVGGAEQILAHMDRALTAAGHRSIVVAPEGSVVQGELLAVSAVAGEIDRAAWVRVHAEVRARLLQAIGSGADLVHLHGVDFHAYLPPPGPPVMATLHLPLDWYPSGTLAPSRPNTWLHPVSLNQAKNAPAGAVLQAHIENGVEITSLRARRRRFALVLGRICPEKGTDEAIEAARRAGTALLIAGAAFPYREHQQFLRERVLPRLDRQRRWLGPVGGHQKHRLLAQASCLLVPSHARETSSLVAMEAMAAGTPVIAYRSGALPEIVEHGRTGFIVDGPDAMAKAITQVGRIDPEVCRATASERFPLHRMTQAYLQRYAELVT